MSRVGLFRYFKKIRKPTSKSSSRRRFIQKLIATLGVASFMPRWAWSNETVKNTEAVENTLVSSSGSKEATDLLLYNGKVISLDNGSQIHEAVAIKGSKIVAVGETAALEASASPNTRRINLKGNSVLPGFFDTHPHMEREGMKNLAGLPLVGANSVSEIIDRVAEAAANAKPGEWIIFMPMGNPPFDYVNDPKMLKGGRFPNRLDLDAVAPNNPVYIRSVWGWWSRPPFPAVANSAALRYCGINADTPDPYNIQIVRDKKGNPTGLFLETNRTSLLEYTLFRDLPRFSYQDRLESVSMGSSIYSSLGTTSAYEAHGLTPTLLRAHQDIAKSGELSVRMTSPLSLPSGAVNRKELDKLISQFAQIGGGSGTSIGNFRTSGVTLDYGMDPTVSEMIAGQYPYGAWAGHYSQSRTESEFIDIGIEAAKNKLRLHTLMVTNPPNIHLDKTLYMLEQIDKQAPIRDLRCIGFHVIHANAEQLRRIRELGLIITMSPTFFFSQAAELHMDKYAKPMREVLDAGIPLVLGSDNVPPSMLFTCWAALERWDGVRQRHIGESHLSREEVFRMCCQTPHYMNWEEESRGMITKGRAAELVVLEGDPLTCDIDLLPHLKTMMTIVDGRVVYDARKDSTAMSGTDQTA